VLDAPIFFRCTVFRLCEENVTPEIDRIAAAHFDNFLIGEPVMPKLNFARLREVSASYLVPESWLRRAGFTAGTITIAARNLHTWTDFPSVDPDVADQLSTGGLTNLSQFQTPHPAQVVATLRLTF